MMMMGDPRFSSLPRAIPSGTLKPELSNSGSLHPRMKSHPTATNPSSKSTLHSPLC